MKKTGATIIYILFVVLLLGGTIAGVLYLTNGGTTAPRLFDIKLNDTIIDGQQINLSRSKSLEFNVVSKIGQKLPSNLQLRVLPNELAQKISYSIGNLEYTLDSCNDLSALFDITYNENKIIISSDWNLIKFLADYHVVSAESISLNDYVEGKFAFVDLCFISGDLSVKCSLIEFINVTEVELDKSSIVIGGYND